MKTKTVTGTNAEPLGLMLKIVGIAVFREYEVSSEEVQNYIEDLYDYTLDFIATYEEFKEEDVEFLSQANEDPEIIPEVITLIMTVLNDQDLDAAFGEGTTEFAREALKYFVSRKGGDLNEQLQ